MMILIENVLCSIHVSEVSYLFQKYKKKAEFIAWKQAKIYGPVN
jgi:hypothetical protein